jgi:hypothetical protein
MSPSQDSPIPSGNRIWVGYDVFDSADKHLNYEIRTNKAGQSAGSAGATDLLGTGASDPTSQSAIMDYHQNGNIEVVAPISADSTGVEKLWLRVTSGTMTVAEFNAFVWYGLR